MIQLRNYLLSFCYLSFLAECDSQCSEEASPMEVPHVLSIGSLVPIQKSSPERRNQKEIIAGEERPKFHTIKQDAQGKDYALYLSHFRSCFLFSFS